MRAPFFGLLLVVGCGMSAGDACRLDSDCKPGLVCSFTGECVTPESLKKKFTQDTTQCPDASADAEPSECIEVQDIFSPQDGECSEPTTVYKVTKIELSTDEDHGLKALATIGNGILSDSIAVGEIDLEGWVDGTLSAGCNASVAWMTSDADRNDDCSAVYGTGLPFMLPSFSSRPVLTVILNTQLDPTTLRMTGHIDKADFAEGLIDDPTIQAVAAGLTEDVDTDNDGTPDKVSVILNLGLSAKQCDG